MKALELIKENELALLAIGYNSPKSALSGVYFRISKCLHDGWVLVTNNREILLLSDDEKTIIKHDMVKNSVVEKLLEMVNDPSFPLDKIVVGVK